MPSFREKKMEALKSRIRGLYREYEAANKQYSNALDESSRSRLSRQISAIEAEIGESENELVTLGVELKDNFIGKKDPTQEYYKLCIESLYLEIYEKLNNLKKLKDFKEIFDESIVPIIDRGRLMDKYLQIDNK